MRQRTVASLAGIVAVLAAAGLAVQYSNVTARTQPPSTASPGIPVVAAKVERGDVPIYLTGVGTVIAYNTVVVRSQIRDRSQIDFKEGQAVRAGDQLALIDPRPTKLKSIK